MILDFDANPDQPRHENLSDREYEVMRLLASGKSL
jgi:DNA-binding CsgD family transcriptional regulator